MKNCLLILFCLATNCCFAQNWQCFQTGAKNYFINGNGYLRGIRIDSVRTSGDTTVYYPFHTVRGLYDLSPYTATLDSNGGSWLGKRILSYADGSFIFDNIWYDSVVVKTKASVGDSWIFYNDTTSLYYQADLISKDTMTFAGVFDSVKTILITAHDSIGIVSTDPANGFKIILSKNNGFVQAFDLYTFPYHAPNSIYTQGIDYYLDYIIGNTIYPLSPTPLNSIFSLISLVNPTFEELYQWHAGDVYEYSTCNGAFEHYGIECDPVERYYLDTILTASLDTSSVNYNYNGWYSYYVGPFPVSVTGFTAGPFVYVTSSQSGGLTYDQTRLIDTSLMPEEFKQQTIYYCFSNDSSYCVTGMLYTLTNNIQVVGITYFPPFEAYGGYVSYKVPLGLVYSESATADGGAIVYYKNLIYHSRSGISCGSFVIPPTAINDVNKIEFSITLFPNPTTSVLTITSNNRITEVTITNLCGQQVYAQQCNTEKFEIDISLLSPGVYFVRINGTEVRRFVKE